MRLITTSVAILSVVLCVGAPLKALAQTAAPLPGSHADLASRANAEYKAKRFKEAAVLYRQAEAIASPGDLSGDDYNEACSLALAGDKAGALDALERTFDDGWGDAKYIAADSDLVSLHDDPKFNALLATMTLARQSEDKRWGNAGFKSTYSPNLSAEDKVAGLSLLWAQAKYGFANFWHVPDLDWDATYRSYIPQVLATTSTEDYYKVLTRFYALLKDGHTAVFAPAEIDTKVVPIRTRLIDGKVLILGARDAAFDMQGLKAGDEIVAINGQPVRAYAEQTLLPYMSASSPQDLDARMYTYSLLQGHPGDVLQLTIATPSGAKSEHSFTVPQSFTSNRPSFEYRKMPGNIAYVALNEFGDDQDAVEWDKNWAEISTASTIILDLRNNGGGSSSVGAHILATVFDRPVLGSRQESPQWIATYRAWGNAEGAVHFPISTVKPDASRHFSGKVIVLTSPMTYSAAEDTVVLFATSHRGTIVGEATGGSTGQPLAFPLPGGGSARLCTKHDRFADGHEFVGVGVPPDVFVAPTRAAIAKGTDAVLEKALLVATQSSH